MIPQIKEIEGKFPKYATLSQATVTLNDMGDKTISTQIKIDGGIVPDFSFDWEVEFQGERYIQPLREPQASKGNESICSVIDLTFYHKTIYDLKRYFFVEMASTGSGTAMADKYIADLNVNLEQFKVALQDVLDYYHEIDYFDEPITINLNPEWEYAEEKQYVQIQYTHIWDVVQKIYEIFGVRWSIDGREIKIGYPTEEVAHTFEYGFEGGLLKVERQVQSTDIRNSLLGRGGEKNLPYRYFKDEETDAQGYKWSADPDWIPELAFVNFTNLRGKTFRDYVKGWKAQRYGGEPMAVPTEEYNRGYADSAKSEDGRYFNPIEYVEDKESIAKYGLLQGGLENQEDIYPSIQGVEVEPYGRIDEIVGAEQVVVDEVDYTSNITHSYEDRNVTKTFTITEKGTQQFEIISEPFSVSQGMIGTIFEYLTTASMVATGKSKFYDFVGGIEYRTTTTTHTNIPIECKIESIKFYNSDTNKELGRLDNLTQDIKIYYKAIISNTNAAYRFNNDTYTSIEYGTTIDPTTGIQISYPYEVSHDVWYEMEPEFELSVNTYVPLYQIQFGGDIIPNTKDDEPISGSVQLSANGDATLVLDATDIVVEKDRTTLLDIPILIDAYKSGDSSQNLKGSVEYRKHIILSNKETGEVVNQNNLSKGDYYCRVEIECHNNSTETAVFVASLLPTYLLPPTDTEEFKPKFDIWVKNIWGSTRNEGESDVAYAERVWRPILGDRQGEEARVVFSSGNLSGHSDWEFPIVAFAYDNSALLDGVRSEWKLTLAKSTAELEATGLYIPSTKQQANAGDHFFFIGIDMPHQYVLWAEEKLDNYKRDQLLNTAHIKPTWVVQTDKVRLNQLQEGESELLLNALKVGNTIKLADVRFISSPHELLYLQSITYSWGADTIMLPNVEVVLSDKVTTSLNPVAQLQGEVEALTKQVGSLSNIQQVVRAIGDKLYLRKDGATDEVSHSITEFAKTISSKGYRQGAVGGQGWGMRTENGKSIIEADTIIARNELQVNSLVANQVVAVGGKQILSAANITCTRVETTEEGFVCYFDQKRGSVANLFVVGDIAYSQVFNPTNNEVKYYKREVIAISDNSITLSLEGDGDGAPQEGDVIVHYGNTTDTNRQYVIIRDVIGGGYERMLSNLNSVSASGVEYYFAGRLDGNTPRWFVGDAEGDYAEWKDGTLKIKGKVVFEQGSSGLENLEEWAEKQQQIDNAQSKAEIFTEQPTSYKKNDLWILEKEMSLGGYGNLLDVNGVQLVSSDNFVLQAIVSITYPIGTMMVAIKSSDTFNYADWVKKDSYVDELSTNRNWFDAQYTTDKKPHNGVKVGDQFVPYDAQHQVYTYTDNGWVLTSDSSQTTINGGLITSGTIQLGDTEETAKAGITGAGDSDDSIRIWAGLGKENMANAPFRVLQSGKVIAENAEVKGVVKAESGTFKNGVFENVTIKGSISSPFEQYLGAQIVDNEGNAYTRYHQNDVIGNNSTSSGDSLGNMYAWAKDDLYIYTDEVKPKNGDMVYGLVGTHRFSPTSFTVASYINKIDGVDNIDKHDNLALPISEHRELSPDEITWDVTNSGRVIRLVNSSYGSDTATGKVLLLAPSGKYFFEDGDSYSQLVFSREVIELIGYGTNTEFYGWYVLNRKDITTTYSYGTPSKVLYQGVIRNSKLEKFWTPFFQQHKIDITDYVTRLKYEKNESSSGVVVLPVEEGTYRGLDDTNNWEVLCTNAVVKAKSYDESQNTIRFQVGILSNAEYVAFQVISTADWEKI